MLFGYVDKYENCGTVYNQYNYYLKVFLIFMLVYIVVFLIQLIKYKRKHVDITIILKNRKAKIVAFFALFILLSGIHIYLSIKINDYKNKDECASYYK